MRQLQISRPADTPNCSQVTEKNIISMSGSVALKVQPDLTRINIKIQEVFKSTEQAYAEGKTNLSSISDSLEKLGLESDLAKTKVFNISEHKKSRYNKGNYDGEEKDGYSLYQVVYIVMNRDNDLINSVISSIQQNIPNAEIDLDSLLSNYSKHKLEAMRLAVLDAKEKAETLVNAIGCNLGQIIRITYGDKNKPTYYSADKYLQEIRPSQVPLQLHPEDEEIKENVEVIWELLQ